MIIVRSPLRITLGGGGTDLPSYYREHEGFLIAGAIDKYVYITLNHPFNKIISLKYSEMERVRTIEEVRHPIFREALKMIYAQQNISIELASFADIPAGTGLGSSGSFTTALLKALHVYNRELVHPEELAQQACDIEINRLQEPVGKQDQYIASFGGLTCFEFKKNDEVRAYSLKLSKETLYRLEDNLLLFFTGYARSASMILKEQHDQSLVKNEDMLQNLHFIKELGMQSKEALESGDLNKFGKLMNVHWEYKKKRSGAISNSKINEWYDLALKNGALGGKLIGAGGGGVLMFYASDEAKLRQVMMRCGLEEIRFKFDFEGTKVVAQS